ncbi:MAG: DUF4855 domain-containing protein [Bacteroidales bacterium]|nr:DUF4855 domain-containing protein [Bacteroidales bacterium]MDD4712432.1 DUF4855 domain-containing protein [Bacteroidales bacterium]
MMRRILSFLLILVIITPINSVKAQKSRENKYKTSEIRDLALIYQGGKQRIEWTPDQFLPYVTHQFADGTKDWLFDGFLFLEFTNGEGYNYAYGYDKKQARKIEWEWLLDRVFEKGKGLDALDRCIECEKKNIGEAPFKHKIILGVAIPLPKQKDWGVLDGESLDFNIQTDQVKAAEWYIDQLMARFKKAKYKNLELSGFYWVDEDIATCKDLPKYVSQYIHSKKKKFIWIPYWKAKGYDQWKELGFDIAYQQPNYFFTATIPYSRLDEACEVALDNGMAMEFECDSKALYNCTNSSYNRMLDYIKAFEKNGVFETSAIAYYTGSKGFIDMYYSTSPEDKKIMDRLARHIVIRRNIKALTK